MKFKLIVAALGLIASAASHAALTPTTTPGGSSLMLSVWEDGATSGTTPQSYMLNLGTTLSQFVAADNSSATLATLLPSNAIWSSFLSTSSTADLQWSVIASGAKVLGTVGSYGIFGTISVGSELDAAAQKNGTITAANTGVSSYLINQNGADELVSASGSGSDYLDKHTDTFNNGAGWSNGNAIGAVATAQESLLVKGASAASLANSTVLPGTFSFSQTPGNSYVLSYNVSAVPEAPASTMVMAGLGLLGLVAVRRKQQR